MKYSFSPRYSNAGYVSDVTPDVTNFNVGDRAVARAKHLEYYAVRTIATPPIPDAVSDQWSTYLESNSIMQ